MVPVWANDYIGIPYEDAGRTKEATDCWGLLRMVMRDQFNIGIPEFQGYQYIHTDIGRESLAAMMSREVLTSDWVPIALTQEEIRDYITSRVAKVGDGLRLRMGRCATHVGTVLDQQYMLHTEKGIESVIEDYTSPKWIRRIYEVYRHKELLNA